MNIVFIIDNIRYLLVFRIEASFQGPVDKRTDLNIGPLTAMSLSLDGAHLLN